MPNDNIKRNNTFSNGDLIALCNRICVSLYSDVAEFEQFGINLQTINNFKSLNTVFANMMQDKDYEVRIKEYTDDKNNYRKEILVQIRKMEMRAIMAFGKNNPIMNQFYKKLLYNTSDKDLLVFARSVAMSTELYYDELSVYGLTHALLDEFKLLNQNYENAMNNQQNAITEREEAAISRKVSANELFDKAVKYCDIGKTIFLNKNAAKYNQYLIYSGNKIKVPASVRKFKFDTDRFTWLPNARAKNFELQEFRLIKFKMQWKSTGTTSETFFICKEDQNVKEYRIRATNEFGNGVWREIKSNIEK